MGLPASVPVFTCAEAKVWEAGLLKEEGADWAAMQRAGAALATAIADDFREIGGWPAGARILVLVGKGHNGGDALLAVTQLLASHPGVSVDLLPAHGEGLMRPLTRRALVRLRETGCGRLREPSLAILKVEQPGYDLCLDGVFGFQFRPPLDERTAELLAWVNTQSRLRFRAAVDLPSGLGESNVGTVFRADFTYATGIVKAPLVLAENAGFVGRLRYLDLGFFAEKNPPARERVMTAAMLEPLTRLRPPQSDKRSYGHLFVIGGSHSYPGAVVMAVRAALHSGTGLVTAFVPERFAADFAVRHPEVMWVGCPENASGGIARSALALVLKRMPRADAILLGPGLAADPDTTRLVCDVMAATTVPVVLDADALRPEVVMAAHGRPFIGTPHGGEYQRIAPALAAANQAVLVLKGPLTRIIHSGAAWYSPFGGPVLARGGSGDILAGVIGGLLAQQPDDLPAAACRGVVWHGLAADLLARTHGQVSVETSQLIEQLGPALTRTSCQTP
jgi:NAD(P)H-hydrate epimerase